MFQLPKATAQQIHQMEENYTFAKAMLDDHLQSIVHDAPLVKDHTGLSAGSALFEYVFEVLSAAVQFDPDRMQMLIAICAAALTDLARTQREDDPIRHLDFDNE
jgi:hypothetical protein